MRCANPAINLVATLLCTLLLVTGCATAPLLFNQQDYGSDSAAVVYIYRPNASANALVATDVMVDDSFQVAISNNQFITMQLAEGQHHFKLSVTDRYEGNHELLLNTQVGQAYFLRIDTAIKFQQNKPYDRRFDLLPITEAEALTQIAQCNPADKVAKTNSKPAADKPAGYSNETFRNPFAK